MNLVDRLAPLVPVARQPLLARTIAEVIAGRPSSMANSMFVRQSIIRRGTATDDQVIEGLAAWVTVLFDLANLQHDRGRALDLEADLPDDALARLDQALARSCRGCILAVPHIGSIELFAAHLKDRGFNLGSSSAGFMHCPDRAGTGSCGSWAWRSMRSPCPSCSPQGRAGRNRKADSARLQRRVAFSVAALRQGGRRMAHVVMHSRLHCAHRLFRCSLAVR
ncbi:hypothetical protein [Burkholderia sp. Ac-20353]|uniref:hypothetical protein n=1 Tax=Burkholderia sp. Ac-20353 TaxID=2703894 RepID=UPI00197B6D0C|nr:hypothetical protein [Burkholderia sp. Ac-20353]MBN3789336.1 hypothetical protein [Burkholderia sp. Ac-20353]